MKFPYCPEIKDSPVHWKNYQNIFRFSKYFKVQFCWSSHWLVVHKMGLLQQRSFYPNLRFWCKTSEWHHSWQELWNFGTGMVLTAFLISHVKTTTPQEIKTAASDFILSLTLALCWCTACKPEAKCTTATTLCLAEILCSPLCLNECLWNSTQTKTPNEVPVVFEIFSKSICSLQNFWGSMLVHC